MNTTRNITGFSLLVFAHILPVTAMAESDFQIGGAVGMQTKHLEYKFVDRQASGLNVDPTIQTFLYSLVTSYGRFFANIELETTIEGDTQYAPGGGTPSTTNIIESKRSDSGITLGYNLWRGLSVFGGYKLGETESNISPVDGGVLTLTFSQRGPFAGMAYTQPIGTKGSVVVSAAYANLDGEVDINFVGTGTRFTSGGSTSGLSYGIGWTGSLSENAYYRLSFKANNYTFKDKDLAFEGKNLSNDENYRIFGLSVGTTF